MEISICKGNVEVSDRLRAAVQEKVAKVARFLDGMERAEVHFFEERNPRIAEKDICEVTMHGHGHVVRAKAAAHEPVAAVDLVVDKLEHQLERLKGKLVARSHPRKHAPVSTAAVREPEPDDDEPELGRSRIVKSKKFSTKPMTPEEAALQMELVGHDFYFFSNSDTGQHAVVYRRGDGDVGLIDAE